MALQIVVPSERISNVLSDLARRRSNIQEIVVRADNKVRSFIDYQIIVIQKIVQHFFKKIPKLFCR